MSKENGKAINEENTILAIPRDDEHIHRDTDEMAEKGSTVDIPEQCAFLEVIESGEKKRRIDLKEGKIIIGRSSKCDIQFPDKSISRKHASLHFHEEEYLIRDLESTNGIYLNGVKIEKASLRNGDFIELGEIKMLFIEN